MLKGFAHNPVYPVFGLEQGTRLSITLELSILRHNPDIPAGRRHHYCCNLHPVLLPGRKHQPHPNHKREFIQDIYSAF